jgi:hypothetical protein
LSPDASTRTSRSSIEQGDDFSSSSLQKSKSTKPHELENGAVIPTKEKENMEKNGQYRGGAMSHAVAASIPFDLLCHMQSKDPDGDRVELQSTTCLEKDAGKLLYNSMELTFAQKVKLLTPLMV